MDQEEAGGLSPSERAFRARLASGSGVPPGLTDGAGRPAGRRFDVYRNNVAVGLREALESGFPAVARLLGPANFDGLARAFLQEHHPAAPVMQRYGAGFPEFLATRLPPGRLGYLPDVARLELALRHAYHAADATPIGPETLAGLHEDTCLSLVPAAALLRSAWPVFSVYRFAMQPGSPRPAARAEDVLITRPGFDPDAHLLPPGGAAMVAAFAESAPLGAAIAAADADAAETLTLLLREGALAAPKETRR
ncbi:HvfC/BufC N-terminal domain-containing protein [Allosediminivita pacifica]|uniref:HvfC/BufC N-terminal domain-containing protein n=1 Tax=Allosediminivita pacifica TaxID=1267769 RepID=UPI001FCEF358|nr:DNA-binding domain-containing protein [Allosediminivita pacifica]